MADMGAGGEKTDAAVLVAHPIDKGGQRRLIGLGGRTNINGNTGAGGKPGYYWRGNAGGGHDRSSSQVGKLWGRWGTLAVETMRPIKHRAFCKKKVFPPCQPLRKGTAENPG